MTKTDKGTRREPIGTSYDYNYILMTPNNTL